MIPPVRFEELLQQNLLNGVSIVLADGGGNAELAIGGAVRDTCTSLGARFAISRPGATEDDELDAAMAAVAGREGSVDLLTVDGWGMFVAGRRAAGSGHAALRACLDGAWSVTRAVVNRAFLPGGPDEPAGSERGGGRIVYVAPSPAAGEYAEAARAGLENLARTLSIEWARYGITTVTIAPGVATTAGEVAALVAYLASPAGAYFSGCQLDLRGIGPLAGTATGT